MSTLERRDEEKRDAGRQLLNERLWASEDRLRRKVSLRIIRNLQDAFKAEANAAPKLWLRLYRQRDPYDWIYRRALRARRQPGQTGGQ